MKMKPTTTTAMMKLLTILVGLMATTKVNTHQVVESENYGRVYGDQPTSYFEQDSLTNRFNKKLSLGQYLAYSQRALGLVAGFDNDLHRYDSREDLINSFGRNLSYRDDLSQMRAHIDRRELELLEKQNELTLIENEQNQSKCGQHLAYLLERLQHIMTNITTYSSSRELDILNFVDSFGSPESELMMGNSAWFGSYGQCLEAKFKLNTLANDQADNGDTHYTSSGRYCIASFEAPPPANDNHDPAHLVKLALCLPQSCNSISIFRHEHQIDRLAKLVRLNQLPYSHYRLSNLFCLPDENSPLRRFNLSAKLFIITLTSWLTLVVYFSLKYEYIRMNKLDDNNMKKKLANYQRQDKLMRAFAFRLSWSNLFPSLSLGSSESQQPLGKPQIDLFKMTTSTTVSEPTEESLKARNLLETLKSQDHLLIAASGKQPTSSSAPLVCVVNSSSSSSLTDLGPNDRLRSDSSLGKALDYMLDTPKKSKSIPKIDLSIMDGIKVFSMVWLIMAHTLLFFIRTIANGRDFWSILRDPRYLTVMAGIFPVDTFFTVTGILTAYLKFNKQDAIGSPRYWLEALAHRYLRFMPMYLIVFWFSRDVSEYIGSGPLWDYSTANTSLRSICKQESLTVPLLFQANFKPLDHHCVKPAWYLANDYQFLMVAPLFMMLIMKSVRLGYTIIGLSIVCSLVAQFWTVFYSSEVEDFGALINFKPMFATYVLKNLWQLYVLPYNRIPPYLIGMLTGHLMYTRAGLLSKTDKSQEKVNQSDEQKKIDANSEQNSKFQSQNSLDSASSSDDEAQDRKSGSESTSNILNRHRRPEKSCVNLSDYLCIKVWTPLVCLISIIYFPLLTKLVTQEGLSARIGTSVIIAAMRFGWSLAIARLIYVSATRFLEVDPAHRAECFVVRFLASPMWKPWSKIGLTTLLIQWEVIGYLAQSQTSVPDMSMTFLLATMLACIFVTYFLAILIYLTIEYPLSQFEQIYIIPALFHK